MAQQKAEEAQAEKAQTEKDMINDIRENRRRDRRVSFLLKNLLRNKNRILPLLLGTC